MTSVVTLMINDVDGFRLNFSLKSKYLLRPVQTKTKCSAGLGDWMSALTKVQTDRWRHRSSCVNNHRKCVDFLGDLKAAWFLCLLAQLCHCIFSLTFAISSTLPLFLSLEPCTQPLTVYGTQHAWTGGLDHRSAGSQSCLCSFSSLIADCCRGSCS